MYKQFYFYTFRWMAGWGWQRLFQVHGDIHRPQLGGSTAEMWRYWWISGRAAHSQVYTASFTVKNRQWTHHLLKKYSQKRNCSASVPISTFMCLWFIYSHDRSAYSSAGKYVDWSWEYINRSQTHECGNWDWGRAIPFLGIPKWDFLCSVS